MRHPARSSVLLFSAAACLLLASSGFDAAWSVEPPAQPGPTVTAPGVGTPGPTATAPPTTTPTVTSPPETAPPPTAPDGTPAPISEQVGPPESPLPDPSRHIHVLLAELDVQRSSQKVTDAQQSLDDARAASSEADAAKDTASREVTGAEAALGSVQRDLASYGAWAYMYAGDGEVVAGVQGDLTATQRKKQFLAASIEHQDDLVRDARQRVDDAHDAVAERDAAAAAATQSVDDHVAGLDAAEQALRDARLDQVRALADERNETGTWQLTLEGPSTFDGSELAQYFVHTGQQSRATVPIEDLAGYYVDEGNLEGIRGDMAFAQAILETGSFGNLDTIDRNNFAGIGHCSDCDGGFIFDTAQLGVRGQMQLLMSYSSPDAEHAEPLVDPRLVGPTGCCQNWNQLAGVWAGDLNYGPRIQSIYVSMLEWLVTQRTGSPPPPAPPPRQPG